MENLPDNVFEAENLQKNTKNILNLKLKVIFIYFQEIGPRLKLRLHKIEEGLMRGNILFHKIGNFD